SDLLIYLHSFIITPSFYLLSTHLPFKNTSSLMFLSLNERSTFRSIPTSSTNSCAVRFFNHNWNVSLFTQRSKAFFLFACCDLSSLDSLTSPLSICVKRTPLLVLFCF